MAERQQAATVEQRDHAAARGGGCLAWSVVAILGIVILTFFGALLVGAVAVDAGDRAGDDVRAGQTDEEIRAAVQAGIRRDARLPADSAIIVTVEQGAVTLAGAVTTFSQKVAVGDVVRHTAGAVLIDNQLQVRPVGSVSDQELEQMIVTGLGFFDATRGAGITVEIQAGIATLGGTVDSLIAKRRAYELATAIVGVREIRDTIVVEPRRSQIDQEITDSVLASFHASPLLRDQEIVVSTENGVITLSGEVRDLTSLELAEELAIYTHGARGLINQLTVQG